MAIGHSKGAYANIPIQQDYLGEASKFNAELGYKYNALRQDKADKLAQGKQAQDKAKSDELKENKPLDLKSATSLNDNLEGAKYDIANQIQENYLELNKAIESSADRSEITRLKAKQSQLKNNFDAFNDFSAKTNETYKYLTEHQADYDPDSYEEQLAKLTMAGKGYGKIHFDDTGHAVYSMTDPDGNVVKGEENKSLANFLVDISTNSMKKSTFEDDINTTVDKLGVQTKEDDKGVLTTVKVNPTPASIKTAKETFFNDFLNDKSSRYRLAKDNNIDINDVGALKAKVDSIFDSKISKTTKNLINTAQENYLAGRSDRAKDEAKDEESYTPDTEIPVDLQRAGLEQGKNTIVTVQNSKAKPSVSFEQKGTGKNVNFKNVSLQQISRVVENGKPRYIVKVSHLKPTTIIAEGGEDLGGGKTAKKGEKLDVGDVQTSEVMKVSEATALLLAKSKKIKNKEDLRNVTPISETKAKAEPKKEINRADISAKAKSAGYSTKEYEALLIKNGITIK